jgi:hypothetical protein
MTVYQTILQGSEAIEKFALDFAQSYDFSEDDIEEQDFSIHYDNYIDTINGIEIFYNNTADYYFFSSKEIQ